MNFSYYDTNEDCKKCHLSKLQDIGIEYEDQHWFCNKGYDIDFANENNKPCGLKKGKYYTVKIIESINE